MAEQSPFSSSFTYGWKYDVFLNFRGEDTRFDFTRNLYNALHRKGIRTFMDDEGLRKGEGITPSLVKAIQESRIAITIFSKNYASSTFCLDELVHILESIKQNGRLVLPVFYDVDPSEVRYQRENYAKAFAKHEKGFKNDKEKVRKWRLALQDAANLSGLHFKLGDDYECHFIEKIVKEISRGINPRPLHITNYPVGLEYRVLKVNSLLEVGSNEGVQMVGIYGIGGIGKTTIARAVCNLIADTFEGFCFLSDVRENSTKHGLVYLQKWLLSELVGEDINIRDFNSGIPLVKHRPHKKKVLLVLDDVDKLKQLRATAGGVDWFGSGSKIIITTRDKHVLTRHNVERIYEVESLNRDEALELLRWNAFGQNRVDPSYMESLNSVVLYACGLPLALEIIGSNLFRREKCYWDSALENYQRIPIKEIQQVLKVSYDALEEREQEIFLDIACCFKGDALEYVKNALCARGICPDYSIEVLIDKCLIKIDSGHVTMHDLIQNMGKEIVRLQSPNEPGKRTRLWFHKDIIHVLEENKATGKIEVINLDMPGDEHVDWNGKAFQKMSNLKMLIIRNAQFSTGPKYLPSSLRVLDWKGYPSPYFPSDFNPKELIILKMPESCLKSDEQLKKFRSLSVMDFGYCEFLRGVPDLSGVPNLMDLCLEGCNNLTEVHVSIGSLPKLKRLSIKNCMKLRTLPDIRSTSLEFLDLSWCFNLRRFPEILGIIENIRDVFLDHSGVEELPLSFRNLTGLQKLQLTHCYTLREVGGISRNLKELSAVNCENLTEESCGRLLDQALHEVDGLKFIIQGAVTPTWLDNCTQKRYVSFWIQKKLPNMVLCLATDCYKSFTRGALDIFIQIQINGLNYGKANQTIHWVDTPSPLIYLFDLQSLFPGGKLDSVVLGPEWNQVEISCYPSKYHADEVDTGTTVARIAWTGIYVCRQKFRMEDIRFTNPYPSKSSLFGFNIFKSPYPFH